MKVQAKAKGLRVSARKIGLVAGLVRGRTVADSLVILEHTPRRAASMLKAVIKSASANAEHNHKLTPDKMTVREILIGPGGMIKRAKPVAFGAAHPIRHRLSQVTVTLASVDATEGRKVKEGEANGTKS